MGAFILYHSMTPLVGVEPTALRPPPGQRKVNGYLPPPSIQNSPLSHQPMYGNLLYLYIQRLLLDHTQPPRPWMPPSFHDR